MLLHWIHDTNPGPLSILSINLVAHDGFSKVMGVDSESKRVEWKNSIPDLTADVPKFCNVTK